MSAKKSVPPFAVSSDAPGSGCYSLLISLRQRKSVRVGKLGVSVFPDGFYVYTGSAMNGLTPRLRRHLSREKTLRWHIDYLLALPEACIERLIVYPPRRNQECRQNRRIGAHPEAVVLLKKFGASDCKSGCAAHLFYFPKSSSVLLQRLCGPGRYASSTIY